MKEVYNVIFYLSFFKRNGALWRVSLYHVGRKEKENELRKPAVFRRLVFSISMFQLENRKKNNMTE